MLSTVARPPLHPGLLDAQLLSACIRENRALIVGRLAFGVDQVPLDALGMLQLRGVLPGIHLLGAKVLRVEVHERHVDRALEKSSCSRHDSLEVAWMVEFAEAPEPCNGAEHLYPEDDAVGDRPDALIRTEPDVFVDEPRNHLALRKKGVCQRKSFSTMKLVSHGSSMYLAALTVYSAC